MLKNKENPWNEIPADDYEAHMSHPSVMQFQILKEMINEQINDYPAKSLMYLGVSTGNGLEFVPNTIEKIYGIDFNKKYLDLCGDRFCEKLPGLELFEIDLNREFLESKQSDLIVANLILEFVDTDSFIKQILAAENDNTVLSIIFQEKKKVSVVSNSGVSSIKALTNFNREVAENELLDALKEIKYEQINNKRRILPDGKEFIRIDLKKQKIINHD